MLESFSIFLLDAAMFVAVIIAVICFAIAVLRLLRTTYDFLVLLCCWLAKKVSACVAMLTNACSFIALFGFLVLRGRLTVRASSYLLAMSRPNATPELCNRLALSIDAYAAKQLLPETRYYLNEFFNGNRLALISEARLQGFMG